MKTDPPIAKAELKRAVILVSHHLRQIEADADVDTAAFFNTSLGNIASQATRTLVRCKVKRRPAMNTKENIAIDCRL